MNYKGFYKKDINTRKEILKEAGRFDETLNVPLREDIYEHMIENAIGVYEVPLGVVPNLIINDTAYTIPMATEESSVIAAANNGANYMNRNGGIQAVVVSDFLRGEVIFSNPHNKNKLLNTLHDTNALLEVTQKAHPSIIKRGGGVKKFEIRTLMDAQDTFIILDVFMDTKEAMGANMMNTVLEKLGTYIELETNESVLMAILTNHNPDSIVKAECIIDPETLKFSHETAKRIAQSSKLSILDTYRCATHNKGVMNGIDAVVLASGNDTRAINASIYTHHVNQPITTWVYEDNLLKGFIEIPLSVGTVGGSISVHPKAQLFKKISNIQNKHELMMVIASIGLTQNFAALYALNTDGIQKGHMSLHAKNILIALNCPQHLLEMATQLLLKSEHMNTETAQRIINDLT